MRKGFSLVTAIFVIVLMATLGVLVLSTTAKTTQNTITQFRHEQAALLAKSYTEFAILSVLDYNRTQNGDCIQTINGNIGNIDDGSGYQVTANISYIGNNLPCNNVLNNNINTYPADSAPAIIVDVFVRYKDQNTVAYAKNNNINVANLPFVTYHRRTLQKI
ncbi:MAG TPA: type II secretion system protein [Epsilonproteobacteria bacterium]|nr:type II secretion system protein [Campylobacterota bacterium]